MVGSTRKKNLAIVGTGISGCIAALYAITKNIDVSLFEKSKDCGGILKDSLDDHNEPYFNSCQYINPEEKWFNLISKENFEIKTFFHDKATYSDIFDEIVLEKDIAGPFLKKDIKFDLNFNKKNSKISLRDRISMYPTLVAKNMIEWLKTIEIDPNEISWNASTGLAINRFFFRNNIEVIKNKKQKDNLIDDLIGLSREEMGLKQIDAALPAKGYNHFFNLLKKKLIKENVKINLSSVVKPIWKDNHLFLNVDKKNLSFDKVIWTGNPTGLIRNYGLPMLESKHINSKHFYFQLDGKVSNDFYIQIYSNKIPINRLFLYNLLNKDKLTVETLSTNINTNEVIKFCNYILDKFTTRIKVDEKQNNFSSLQKKYILFSINDEKIIKNFIQSTKKSNLIQGNWLEYGRDHKINYLLKEIDKI